MSPSCPDCLAEAAADAAVCPACGGGLPAAAESPREPGARQTNARTGCAGCAGRLVVVWMLAVVMPGAVLLIWLGLGGARNIGGALPELLPELPAPDHYELSTQQAELIAEMRELARGGAISDTPASLTFDPESVLRRFEGKHPDAVKRAREQHRPFTEQETVSVHRLFDAMLERAAETYPDVTLYIDSLPCSGELEVLSPEARARDILLTVETLRALESLPPTAITNRHVRTDIVVFRDSLLTALLWEPTASEEALATFQSATSAFVILQVNDCCDDAAHARAAIERMRGLGELFDTACDLVYVESQSDVAVALDTVESADEFFDDYPEQFEIGAGLRRELRVAAARAQEACDLAGERIREGILRRALGREGVGSQRLALAIAAQFGDDTTALDVYEEAVDELEAAFLREAEYVDAWYDEVDAPAGFFRQRPEARVREVHDRGSVVVSAGDSDPGVLVFDVPVLWSGQAGYAYYLAAPLGPTAPGRTFMPPIDEEEVAEYPRYTFIGYERTLAHETYPGHHTAAHLHRESCTLRQFTASDAFVEGWAEYAEERFAEAHYDDADAAWFDIVNDQQRALRAVLDIALQSRAISTLRAARWDATAMEYEPDGTPYVVDEVGMGIRYMNGMLAIERVVERARAEMGRAYSAQRFHRRLLENGPIPPALAERELLGPR